MYDQPKQLDLSELTTRPGLNEITVIIPTLGRAILETCLYWIAVGNAWPGNLIIVDQGSNPQVASWLAQLTTIGLPTTYLPSTQRGRAAGINRGLERVTTQFVAITDDDCFVAADWLETMVQRLRQSPETIFTGRVEFAGDTEVAFSVVTADQRKVYTQPQLKVHPFIGGNAGLARALVERVGFFDEHPCLQAAEDNDYGYRALRLGIPIAYDPTIVLHHYHWRDSHQRSARYADYARSQGGFYGTHLRRGDGLILAQTVRDLIRGPVRWLRGVIKRDQDMMARGAADTLNLAPGIVAGLRRKSHS